MTSRVATSPLFFGRPRVVSLVEVVLGASRKGWTALHSPRSLQQIGAVRKQTLYRGTVTKSLGAARAPPRLARDAAKRAGVWR